jgi:hypothetical protein
MFHLDPAHQLYDRPLYSIKLVMMNRGTVRKHVEFHSKNKFEKLMRLVGFIIRKFIMMHCHINVKLLHNVSCLNN